MIANEWFDQRLRGVGQSVPRSPHIGKLGFSALGGNHAGVQQGVLGGRRLEAAIAVPEPVAKVKQSTAIIGIEYGSVDFQVGDVDHLAMFETPNMRVDYGRRGFERA